MNHRIDDLIRRIRELQEELEVEFRNRREEFHFIVQQKRILFAEEVARQHRRLKTGLFRGWNVYGGSTKRMKEADDAIVYRDLRFLRHRQQSPG